jgi:hypothetical protein
MRPSRRDFLRASATATLAAAISNDDAAAAPPRQDRSAPRNYEAWLEIDEQALRHNVREIARLAGNRSLDACTDRRNLHRARRERSVRCRAARPLHGSHRTAPRARHTSGHAARSVALFFRPDIRLDIVRPGLALYGAYPAGARDSGRAVLRPAFRLRARVARIRTRSPNALASPFTMCSCI